MNRGVSGWLRGETRRNFVDGYFSKPDAQIGGKLSQEFDRLLNATTIQ